MRIDIAHPTLAWLSAVPVSLLIACGGGDGGPTPPPDDEEFAKEAAAEARAANAAVEFEDLVTSGNPDPIGALVASLQADPNITDVHRIDSAGSVVATLNGVPFGVLVAEEDRPEWAVVSSGATSSPRWAGAGTAASALASLSAVMPPIACDSTKFPQSKKACILRSGLTVAGAVQDQGIEESLQRAGFTPTTLPWPTTAQQIIDLHQTLSTCGVLYIRAHGGATQNKAGEFGNHLVTEVTSLTPQERQLLRQTFDTNAKHFFGIHAGTRTKKSYVTLSPQFFASVKYPNTLVFTNACGSGQSLQGLVGAGVLEDAFKNNGAGAFLGWKGTVSAQLAGSAATELFAALAPKVVVDAVTVTVNPPDPGPGESYVPSATITPAVAGVEVSIAVRGSDGYVQDDMGTTDASGTVTFASVPGGEGEVTDSITVVAGGANDSQTAENVIQNSPTLQTQYGLPYLAVLAGIKSLEFAKRTLDFNLVCNSQKAAQTVTLVKF